jgi:hypothetical protein
VGVDIKTEAASGETSAALDRIFTLTDGVCTQNQKKSLIKTVSWPIDNSDKALPEEDGYKYKLLTFHLLPQKASRMLDGLNVLEEAPSGQPSCIGTGKSLSFKFVSFFLYLNKL